MGVLNVRKKTNMLSTLFSILKVVCCATCGDCPAAADVVAVLVSNPISLRWRKMVVVGVLLRKIRVTKKSQSERSVNH